MGNSKMAKTKNCVQCDKEFTPRSTFQKYCSFQCSRIDNKERIWKRNKNGEGETFSCKTCGKEFYLPPCRIRVARGVYCSRQCQLKDFRSSGQWRKCRYCDNKFWAQGSQIKAKGAFYCNMACMRKHRRKTIKIVSIDRLWARAVKEKAGNKCEYCGKQGRLNSHHVFSRKNYSVRWDVDNGVCLCVTHHIFGNMSAHQAPLEFAEWLKEHRGAQWYCALREKAKADYVKITEDRKREIIKAIEEILGEQ